MGVLTGFRGVGGGFLSVPALVLFAGLDFKHAIGTSLAIIALNSVSGLLGQMRYADVNLDRDGSLHCRVSLRNDRRHRHGSARRELHAQPLNVLHAHSAK